jgi:hypothetical protein
MTDLRLLFVLPLLVAGAVSCDNDCARRLETEIRYTGTRTGTAYHREIHPKGQATAAGSSAATGPATIGTGTACWQSTGSGDEAGWQLEGWIDVDGDDAAPCHENPLNLDRCRPDPGEPQGRKSFTISAEGTTKVVLEFGDP